MRKGRWWGAAVLLLVAVAAGGALWWQQRGPWPAGSVQAAKPPADAASAVPLEFRGDEVVQASRASLPERIEFSGPLVAPNTAVLRAKASGTLLSLAVAEGSRVQAGQLLGRIDMAELGSRIAERSAYLESARATLLQAERSHANNLRLAAQNFISPSALDNSRAQLDTARAALAAAQATLDTTRVAQRDATLIAPIAGIVAKRQVLPGEKLSVEQPVLTIVDLRRLELAASVGTHEVARLAAGMPVQVQVEGVDQPRLGEIARIAPAAEPGTRVIAVTIALANPDERLRAGQYAVASATLADDRERLSVPETAVTHASGQSHVWVIADGKLARRAVRLGRRDGRSGQVEVLSGLAAGGQVIAARFDGLVEGRAASVAGDAAVAASAAASAPLRLQ